MPATHRVRLLALLIAAIAVHVGLTPGASAGMIAATPDDVSSQADPPTVTFSNLNFGQITNINNFQAFTFDTDENGVFVQQYKNNTGQLITDFHFVAAVQQPAAIVGTSGPNPNPFFGLIPAGTTTTVDFSQGGTGTGIGIGSNFLITLDGFTANTRITANATMVPEPSALVLFGCGILGLLGVVRQRRRVAA
jgi:hypothetical protein